ncbi:hypothetical protein [Micromonospora kangleipakensis]|uniref:hypothetical protein n=1 Tax=Micromonospora kangleipakensis TaxID=1077942 RepID=UPI0010291BC7|nr:hypothetical protein [Micromonospora kangleipakensis]
MASDKPEPSAEQPEERYVVDDALWVVPSSNYVDSGPPLEKSLFDDPQRLNKAWHLAITTLQAEARESVEKKQQIEEQARTYIDEADRAVAPVSDPQPDLSGEAGQPIAEAKGESAVAVVRRLDRLFRATRRVVPGHTT